MVEVLSQKLSLKMCKEYGMKIMTNFKRRYNFEVKYLEVLIQNNKNKIPRRKEKGFGAMNLF